MSPPCKEVYIDWVSKKGTVIFLYTDSKKQHQNWMMLQLVNGVLMTPNLDEDHGKG